MTAALSKILVETEPTIGTLTALYLARLALESVDRQTVTRCRDELDRAMAISPIVDPTWARNGGLRQAQDAYRAVVKALELLDALDGSSVPLLGGPVPEADRGIVEILMVNAMAVARAKVLGQGGS